MRLAGWLQLLFERLKQRTCQLIGALRVAVPQVQRANLPSATYQDAREVVVLVALHAHLELGGFF